MTINMPTKANYRSLIILGLAQCFGQTAPPIMILLGGLVGAEIAPAKALITLPVALMVVGTACTAIPASLLMARIGRKAGFLTATAGASLAGLLATWGVSSGDFWLFCLAAFLVGAYVAFMQQFRFAVAESVPAAKVPKAISILMLAGIVAAFLGPEVATRMAHLNPGMLWGQTEAVYAGSFLGMSGLLALSFCILLFYRNFAWEPEEEYQAPRPLVVILRQPALLLAIAAAVIGWSVMSLVMTATPVSMHHLDQYSLDDTAWVIQSHILAMYIPSLFSGFLIARLGVVKIILSGLVLLAVCLAMGYGSPALMHYWVSLVLLGIGWNFLFLGGTTLLTQSYQHNERFKVQAFNEFAIFGFQGIASLGSGVLLLSLGWNGIMLLSLPMLLVLLLIVYLVHQRTGSLDAVS